MSQTENLITTEDIEDIDLDSYRFIYNQRDYKEKHKLAFILIFFFIGIFVSIFFVLSEIIANPKATTPLLWSLFLISLPYVITITLIGLNYKFILSKQRIVINQKGIYWHGFLFNLLPKFCSWNELEGIYLPNSQVSGLQKHFTLKRDYLIFCRKNGTNFIFASQTWRYWQSNAHAKYIGENCACTMIEAIEKFTGKIEPIGAEKQAKIYPISIGTEDLGDKTRNVVFTAFGIFLLTFIIMLVLSFVSNRAISLNSFSSSVFYWGISTGAFIIACSYMSYKTSYKNILYLILTIICVALFIYAMFITSNKQAKLVMFAMSYAILFLIGKIRAKNPTSNIASSKPAATVITAFLFAGCVSFLLIPMFDNIPLWFGTKQQREFIIVKENEYWQIWQTTSGHQQTLSLQVNSSKRNYKNIGTRKNLIIYQFNGGLCSVLKSEMSELHKPLR